MAVSCVAFPVLVKVATALMSDVMPIAVLGNEKAVGLTVNCDVAGGVAAPREPELTEGGGGFTVGAVGGSGRLLQPAVIAIHGSITAIESQWLRQRSI